MIGPEVQVRGRDRAHAPVCVRLKGLLLVRVRGRDVHLLAEHVDSLRDDGRAVRSLVRHLLDFLDLFLLNRRRRQVHTQNDVLDFHLRQR